MTSDDDGSVPAPQLSETKRLLLAELLRRRSAQDGPARPTLVRSGATSGPLSYSQHQLWLAQELRPADTSYNIPVLIRLAGTLRPTALAQAFAAVVQRHEVLRSVIVTAESGEPEQRVLEAARFPLALVDLEPEGGSLEQRRSRAHERAAAAAGAPFTLAKGCLRAELLRVAQDEHYLVMILHHVAHDGWSTDLLMRELLASYQEACGGPAAGLAPLPAQYLDYARWQRAWIAGADFASHLAAVVQRLLPLPEPVDLPTDRGRVDRPSRRGQRVAVRLDPQAVERARQLAAADQATLAMVLMAVYAALLARTTSRAALLLGTQLANRQLTETSGLLGYFANTAVVRVDLPPGLTFRQLLRQVRGELVALNERAQVPFEQVLTAVRAQSPGAVGPLFQQMFVFQREDQELPPLPFSIESLDFYGGVAKFDLDLSLVERAGEVTGTLEYDAELFDDDTIRRMLGHLDELMRDAVARPDTPVAMLNLLTAEERALALGPWNATAVEFPSERTLHELIQDVADADPGPVAVIRGDATWTRGQIAQHAERLARALRGAGVRRGDVVAICLDRSPEMVWGILGILRAGAAYLPIDPKYPPERVAFMLDDARARVTLTQRTLHDRLAGGGRSVWVLDEDLPASVVAASAPPDHATAADLCYVIYTSGSTGRPKGVMVDHRGRVSNFLDFNRRFAVGPADRLLSVSSIGFDMCAYDVLGTLAAGAAIVLPDAGRELDPSHWLTLIARHQVSVWHSVPALAGLLVEAGRAEPSAPLTSIRLVLLGGDWIPVPLAGELWEQSPRATVVSLGGATEVSMDSTIYVIEQVDPSWRSVPYGRPMANQLAYVLDASGELCPVGVPGELFLGGIGVGWGYLAQPGMTAARFVPDPFAAPGARMYRTGDLARYTRDGTLELLGRIDFQTKIRGHRIELGEIEAALRACGAGQAIVVAVAAPGGRDKRLVGYVLPREGEQLEAEPLRRALSQRVPDYMVPPHVIVLDRFPLTPNGKIDRKSLPAPDAVAATARVVAAPHTPLQQRLHGLWRELLHVESLSIDDDFFAIGGDSIKAIQLTSRARAAGLTLTPADLFRHPTVRELAAVATETSPRLGDREEVARGASLSAERRAALEANLGPIEAIEEVGPMQAHMIRQLARSEVPGLYVNRSGLVLPRVHSRSFQAAWERLLERHSILRSCFVWRDLPRPLRVVLREITLPLRVVDLRGLGRVAQERAVVELAQEERERGFDLEHPPLFRLVLVHLDDDCTILLETEAYPILDGWSAFVLRRELLTAYQAELSGEDVALPAAPPYRAYVDWAHAQGTDAARAYWTTALAACPLLSRSPAPLRGPLARADRRLARADTRALSERARHDGVTLSSLVTLAWAVVESAGGEDALFGVTSSGRSPLIAQCEDVVGLCINTLPVWAHLEGSAQLSALARLLHEQRALAAEHETAPLDELTAALGQRDRLFESVVVFANYPIDPVLRGVEAAAPPFPFAEQLHLAQTEFPLRLDVTVDEELTATAFYYQGTLGAEDVARRLDTLLAALRELGAGVAGTVAELRGRL